MDMVLDIVLHDLSDCHELYVSSLSMIDVYLQHAPYLMPYIKPRVSWMMLPIWPFIANGEPLHCRCVRERELRHNIIPRKVPISPFPHSHFLPIILQT